jgi:hypothetical protein
MLVELALSPTNLLLTTARLRPKAQPPVTAQDWKRHLTAGSNIREKKRKRVDEIRIAVFNGFVSRARLTIGALP